jgi:thiamine-monophosphate kinase
MRSKNQRTGSGEDRLIARYFKPLVDHPGALGLEDDAAFIRAPPGRDLVITTDAVLSSVHFFADDPAHEIARKALRVNLSDLAAKGARPLGFLLTLGLPKGISQRWIAAFARGLQADANAFGCPLLGGDTVRTLGGVVVSITAFGSVPRGTMVRRRGARPGDLVIVTGTIGDGALGLELRRKPGLGRQWRITRRQHCELVTRYRLPQPRSAIAELVRTHASAAMDVSDGLAGDLAKLCRASGVSVSVDVARVPLSKAARAVLAKVPELMQTVLSGGDDYEIVASVPRAKLQRLRRLAAAKKVVVSEIGVVIAGKGEPRFIDRKGNAIALTQLSFSHF